MHNLQKTLLKRLQYNNNQRFGTLTSGYDYDDNIIFHINTLLANELIVKENGIYTLTTRGLKEAVNFESPELSDNGAKSFFIGFLCRDTSGNSLVKSHPNARINFYNLPSGKPYFGEAMNQALVRTFKKNTGIDVHYSNFQFTSLHLKTIMNSQSEIIFDDAFTIFSIDINNKQKESMTLLEGLMWKSKNEIKTLSDKWPEIDSIILEENKLPYQVYTHISDYIL